MTIIVAFQAYLKAWAAIWLGTAGSSGAVKATNCFDKKQGMDFGKVFDMAFGRALADMLGGIPVVEINAGASLLLPQPNCVEVGGPDRRWHSPAELRCRSSTRRPARCA